MWITRDFMSNFWFPYWHTYSVYFVAENLYLAGMINEQNFRWGFNITTLMGFLQLAPCRSDGLLQSIFPGGRKFYLKNHKKPQSGRPRWSKNQTSHLPNTSQIMLHDIITLCYLSIEYLFYCLINTTIQTLYNGFYSLLPNVLAVHFSHHQVRYGYTKGVKGRGISLEKVGIKLL